MEKQIVCRCQELNLDLSRLPNLKDEIFFRLVNILKTDLMDDKQTLRSTVIRELYFMLQLVPVFDKTIQRKYLQMVQYWYNRNDHKRTDLLTDKMTNLYNVICMRKQIERPKSGITWCKTVHPFLRPYTALRRPNSQKQSEKQDSTVAETHYIPRYVPSIEAEKAMSLQFVRKQRTLHPQQEPFYQQLFQLLVQADNLHKKQDKQPSQKEVTKHSTKFFNFSEHNIDTDNYQDMFEEDEEISQESQKPQSNQFMPYKKTYNKEQSLLNLNQQHIVNVKRFKRKNLRIQDSRDQMQFYKKRVEYARIKSAMRRQFNLKSEKRNLSSAKISRSYTKNNNLQMSKINDLTALPLAGERGEFIQIDTNHSIKEKNVNTIDIALPIEPLNKYPTYNQREFLQSKDKKINKTLIPQHYRSLTSCLKFKSPLRYDPNSRENVLLHNAESLKEIDKIKNKMNGNYVSTDSLMKAFFIDSSIPVVDWVKKDLGFGLLSNGEKNKLKKKGKKKHK